MEWFSKWFNEDYELLYPHRNSEEASRMVQLFEQFGCELSDKNVLDMCCGLGRVSIELSKSSKSVHGFDLSSYFIEKCIENNLQKNVSFERLDMREMAFENQFNVIFHIFTSFGYFETEEENLSIFEHVYKALKPNGYYFFDFLNEEFVRENLNPETISNENNRKVIQKRSIKNNRVVKEISIDNDGTINKYEESVMLVSKQTFDKAFEKRGFEIINVFGNYNGSEFDLKKSSRLIYIVRKNG